MNLHKFANKQLDKIWRIHPSYQKSNLFQRMEFYGDKILSFIITSYLFENQNLDEGDLSIFLSSLINKDIIAEIGKILTPYIICTGDLTNAMICDCIEVYIACVYLDGGDVFELIKNLWGDRLFQTFEASYKNQIQEILQNKKLFPIYNYEFIEDNSIFKCIITINDDKYDFTSYGYGTSKKQASTKAAKAFIDKYSKIINKINN